MLRQVWPQTIVDENNLVRQISALRKALDENPNDPHYILTIPGRGYRFVAEVKEIRNETGLITEPQFEEFQAKRETISPAIHAPAPSPQNSLLPKTKPFYQNWRWILLGLAVLVLVGIFFLKFRPNAPEQKSESQRKLWQLTFDPGLSCEPSWSPDENLIAYSSDRSGNFDIWVRPVGEGNPMRVTNSPTHDWQPDWSPLGNNLVFRSEREGGGLYVVPVLGGNERKISSFGYHPRWSSDGKKFFSIAILSNTTPSKFPNCIW